jgi:hypothetical protein
MQMRGEVIRANINAWRGSLEMNREGVFSVHVDAINPVEYALHPGVRRRALLKSDSATGPRILLVEFDPGRGFLELDVHQPGPDTCCREFSTTGRGSIRLVVSSIIRPDPRIFRSLLRAASCW